jgi:hypothetical protein
MLAMFFFFFFFFETGAERDLPFLGNTLEVTALVTVFGSNLVRMLRVADIVLFDNNTVEVDESLCHHVHPAVC